VLPSLAAALVALGLAACGDDEDPSPAGDSGCERVEEPSPKEVSLGRPTQEVRPGQRLTATVETSCGEFEIALATTQAPKTTNSFAHLVRQGFYAGLSFNYVKPEFIQGGDPSGDRTGDPGYFVDEPPPQNLAYTKGTVAMAKTPVEPPGRSGSQFFVVTAADAGLHPDYALLGRIARGLDVTERIAALASPSGQPEQVVLIERINLRPG
jgi:cyclophilin family peptidyl-prolyl cis-trans isomerase